MCAIPRVGVDPTRFQFSLPLLGFLCNVSRNMRMKQRSLTLTHVYSETPVQQSSSQATFVFSTPLQLARELALNLIGQVIQNQGRDHRGLSTKRFVGGDIAKGWEANDPNPSVPEGENLPSLLVLWSQVLLERHFGFVQMSVGTSVRTFTWRQRDRFEKVTDIRMHKKKTSLEIVGRFSMP